jgi:phenylacetate-CoA ligase
MSLIRWFDLSLRLKGFDIGKANTTFQQLLELKHQALINWQQQQARQVLQHHLATNPFYRSFLQRQGVEQPEKRLWHQLPVITKAAMQVPLEQRLSEAYRGRKLFSNNTSGSSGTPFYFAKDLWCHALTWASVKYRFGQHGIDFNRHLQARFYGIPLKGLGYYKEKLKDLMSHRVRFPVFNLNDEVCAGFVQQFRRRPFVYLNGYTSSLVLFARYCISQGLVLRQICPTLQYCFTTSEMCGPGDREVLEQGFGVKVINEYGAAELDLLAVENPEGQWVLNEETLLIEILDHEGLPVPDGQSGKVVVTALFNMAMPFIRYELGDMGTIHPQRLPDGRRILQSLEGRTNDVAILPSGRKVPGLTFYYVTKGLLQQGGNIKEFVIRQVQPNSFVLEYLSDAELTEAERQQVTRLMDTYLEPGLVISFERVSAINRTRVGKLRQFTTEVGKTH